MDPKAICCGTCRFWDPYDKEEGVCRRYPPVAHDKVETPIGPDDYSQPATYEVRYCGEWRPMTKRWREAQLS